MAKKETVEKKKTVEKNETIGTIITENGKKYEAVDENWKYWICKSTQFRKSNQSITFKPRKEND